MVRSHIAGNRHTRAGVMAGAMVVALAAGWSGPACAQAALLSMQYVRTPAFAGVAAGDTIVPLLAGEHALDDCDAEPDADAPPSSYMMVLARAQLGKKPARKKADPVAEAPMAAAAPAPTIAPDASRDWEIIVTDKTLNATMARWAAQAGWQLLWELPVDYAVEARTRVHGTFEEAVTVVAGSMESAEIPMKAVFYQGNKVLRIMAKGSE